MQILSKDSAVPALVGILVGSISLAFGYAALLGAI